MQYICDIVYPHLHKEMYCCKIPKLNANINNLIDDIGNAWFFLDCTVIRIEGFLVHPFTLQVDIPLKLVEQEICHRLWTSVNKKFKILKNGSFWNQWMRIGSTTIPQWNDIEAMQIHINPFYFSYDALQQWDPHENKVSKFLKRKVVNMKYDHQL